MCLLLSKGDTNQILGIGKSIGTNNFIGRFVKEKSGLQLF